MKRSVCLALFFLALFFSSVKAQSNFNIDLYKQFLQEHQDMTTQQLLDMHPAGSFTGDLNLSYEDALYFDSLSNYYQMTEYEKSLIQQNGFMVSQRLSKTSFGEAILEIFQKDYPVFVSTDAILHALHISYDRILKQVELGYLNESVQQVLSDLHSAEAQLNSTYGSVPGMMTMLKDVDVYLTVALKLFDESSQPYYPENNALVTFLVNKAVNAQGMDTLSLFSDACRFFDWSQLKPRGHYDDDEHPELRNYFRAMMWLGRTEIYLIKPQSFPETCPPQSFTDIQRQIIDAVLIRELADLSSSQTRYEEIEQILKFFVGDPDNVTLDNMDFMRNAISLQSADQLLDSLKVVEFQDTLKNQTFAYQLILSQLLYSDPLSPDSIVPASAFLLFGQRFVIDSYVTGSVVFDRIKYLGNKICRLFPSTLDVLFALGNDASAQLLTDELDAYHYSTNLAALRYLINSYDNTFWEGTIYNNWLEAIRQLNPPGDRTGLPGFMKTAAFWQEKMNTQLASWTELRHDNLLYAKQPYTGGSICSFPYSYVEPFPEFYAALKVLSTKAIDYFGNLNQLDPNIKANVIEYFNDFYSSSDTLQTVCEKELNNEMFNPAEISFLKSMLYQEQTSGEYINGWYARMYYQDYMSGETGYDGLMNSNHIVADIHTIPTDCDGTMMGWVKHVGTGPINLAIIVTPQSDGQLTAFAGPVISYFDYTTTNFLRLTDDEWDNTYLEEALRPDWVNIYLADSTGESRGNGATLITSVKEKNKDDIIPQSEMVINNYPNPFNPSTVIAFTIPYDLTGKLVELNIYDITGSLVKTLISKELSAGNYALRWDGKNDKGFKAPSGIYIYSLKAGDRIKNGKMTLLK